MKKIMLLALVLFVLVPSVFGDDSRIVYVEDGVETGYSGTWMSIDNLFDGDWGTTAYSAGDFAYAWINYTKNTYYLNSSLWQVKDYENDSVEVTVNLSLPVSCWSYSENKLVFRVTSYENIYTNKFTVWECHNDSGWFVLRNKSNVREPFEEAMYWVAGNDTIRVESRVSLSLANGETDVVGYCNASLEFNDTAKMSLFGRWYNGSTIFYSYNLSNVSQGQEGEFVLYKNKTLVGEIWRFNCYASGGGLESGWTANSSVVISESWFDNCSTYTNRSININVFDEKSPSSVLPSYMEVYGSYWTNLSTTYNFTMISNTSGNFGVCIISDNVSVQANMYIKYTTDNGFTHRYYLFNETLTNNTINLSLYNFDTQTDISDIVMTIRDAYSYSYLPNVLGRMQRKYVGEGVWRTVQSDLTGDYGQLLFNIEEEDTDYRFIFLDTDNHVLRTTDSMKFICSSGHCAVTYTLSGWSGSTTPNTLVADVLYDNDTGIVSVVWDDPAGRTQSYSMSVTKETGSQSIAICSNSSVASSGNFSCDISGYVGRIEVRGVGVVGGEYTRALRVIEKKGSKLFTQLDERDGALWSAGIVTMAFGMGLFSPAGAAIGVVVGLLFSYVLQLMSGLSVALIVVAAAIGILIGLRVRR